MEMKIPESKYPFLVFDDVLTDEEFQNALEEVSYLDKFIQLPPEGSGSASEDGTLFKKNSCLWLTEFYSNFNYSFLMLPTIKIMSDEAIEAITNYSDAFVFYKKAVEDNRGAILLSKYEDGDYYESHFDVSFYTAVYWLNDDDYEGGTFQFMFDGKELEVENKANRLVLFPSVYQHLVSQVRYKSENSKPRYSVSTFFKYI